MFILLLLLLLSLMLLTILHLHLCQPSWCLACEIHGRFFALVNWLTPVLFIEFSYISWSSCPVLKFPIPEKNTSIWEKNINISYLHRTIPFHIVYLTRNSQRWGTAWGDHPSRGCGDPETAEASHKFHRARSNDRSEAWFIMVWIAIIPIAGKKVVSELW